MRVKRFVSTLIVLAGILQTAVIADPVFQERDVPKYTDYQTAYDLARALDKGTYSKLKITSTYVQNEGQNYYVSVNLTNGPARKWFLNDIYRWIKEEKITLANNRILVFPNPRTGKFKILEKNKFHRDALKAKIYTKEYGKGDPLEGQTFHYQIKSFYLISPKEKGFGKDKSGFDYRYLVNLMNGSQEKLTYLDAYWVMLNKYLSSDTQGKAPIFKKAYRISELNTVPRTEEDNGISSFGVNILFDRDINLDQKNFPYEIYENRVRIGKKYRDQFILDLTIPNSEKSFFEPNKIQSFEYLRNVRLVPHPKSVTDSDYAQRMVLRASFNPDLMNIPPIVKKSGSRKITVTFFHLYDQTVHNRQVLLDADSRKKEEQKSKREAKLAGKTKPESKYDTKYNQAIDAYNAAGEGGLDSRITGYTEVVGKFIEAANEAETDHEFLESLEKVKEVKQKIVILTIKWADPLLKDSSAKSMKSKMKERLEKAESYIETKDTLAEIRSLQERLNKL